MTSRPKIRLREIIWLSLPVVLFGGLGWYSARQSAVPDDQWRVVVDELKLVPITPREVSEGYDTKVMIRPHTAGTPQNLPGYGQPHTQLNIDHVRLTNVVKSKEHITRRADRQNLKYTVINDSEVHVLMKLAREPQSQGEIKLKFEIYESALYIPQTPVNTPSVNTPSGGIKETISSRAPVSIVVRKAGEKVKTPTLHKYRPFTIKGAGIDKEIQTPGSAWVKIVLKYEEQPSDKKPHFRNDAYVQDEKGRKYRTFKDSSGTPYQLGIGFLDSHEPENEIDKNIHSLYCDVPVSQIPKNAGKLNLRISICINDCWLLPISIVVRDKNGKIP